jgi:hypothetical protein
MSKTHTNGLCPAGRVGALTICKEKGRINCNLQSRREIRRMRVKAFAEGWRDWPMVWTPLSFPRPQHARACQYLAAKRE